ncbi:MAG: hypothetical protein JXA21_28175 [Anaerolineae bacterium]|nr:hypothetical protein [Anaerolineae bacterium]
MNEAHHFIPARHPHVRIIGRTADFPPDEIRMGFPGITLQFAYRGPAPTLLFGGSSPDCYFDLQCDDWEPATFQLENGRCEFPLPTGPAPATPRRIRLVRRNESWQGVASYFGMKLPAGCELPPLPPPLERRLLCIGDSITGGEGINRLPPVPDETHRASNARRAFGMLLGQWLGAEVHLVSYGGRGAMRDWEGATQTCNAPQFFHLALPDDPHTPWDHNRFTPDAIIICLGTNDFSKGVIEAPVYTAAYRRFVETVRHAHPAAHILLAESPIFGDVPGTDGCAKRNRLRECLEGVVAARRADGDARIVIAPVSHFPGTVCNAHPVAFQHEQIALAILEPLRRVTGW